MGSLHPWRPLNSSSSFLVFSSCSCSFLQTTRLYFLLTFIRFLGLHFIGPTLITKYSFLLDFGKSTQFFKYWFRNFHKPYDDEIMLQRVGSVFLISDLWAGWTLQDVLFIAPSLSHIAVFVHLLTFDMSSRFARFAITRVALQKFCNLATSSYVDYQPIIFQWLYMCRLRLLQFRFIRSKLVSKHSKISTILDPIICLSYAILVRNI